jgi:hypothetical protein
MVAQLEMTQRQRSMRVSRGLGIGFLAEVDEVVLAQGQNSGVLWWLAAVVTGEDDRVVGNSVRCAR